MTSYSRTVRDRKYSLTKSQAAVLAYLPTRTFTLADIWEFRPDYISRCWLKVGGRRGALECRIRPVAYGTISKILKGFVEDGILTVEKVRGVNHYTPVK